MSKNNGFELRHYQIETIKKIKEAFTNGRKEVVLAACPSSGKTLMAINLIEDFSDKRFLILTHGTNVIKNHWEKEFLKHNITASNKVDSSRVIYGLPQSLADKNVKLLKNIDFLIVDEAHEFTFADDGMVENIVKKLKPKNILYLTGTPSKFIRRNATNKYEIIHVAAEDLLKDNSPFFSDLYLGISSTNAKLTSDDFNENSDIKRSSEKAIEGSVDGDLDTLLESILIRLKETDFFKSSPTIRKPVQWSHTIGVLHKTMIACASIDQAEKVERYFNKKGIRTVLSHYKNDVDSSGVINFETDDSQLLIVVDRGILGFNMPELVNVVDLTGSKNIDRMYQLFARVLRRSDKYPKKYFFKIVPDLNKDLYKFYMEAALSLTRHEIVSLFNGKNLNLTKVPKVIVPGRGDDDRDKGRGPGGPVKPPTPPVEPPEWPIDPFFKGQVTAMKLMEDIYNKIDQSSNEFAFTTIGRIRESLEGVRVRTPLCDPGKMWEKIFILADKNGKQPSTKSKDPYERSLARFKNSEIGRNFVRD